LIGRVPAELALEPNTGEVAATRWMDAAALARVATEPAYAPWLSGVLARAMDVYSPE
jgi:isopentenyldiphosphate isomerase